MYVALVCSELPLISAESKIEEFVEVIRNLGKFGDAQVLRKALNVAVPAVIPFDSEFSFYSLPQSLRENASPSGIFATSLIPTAQCRLKSFRSVTQSLIPFQIGGHGLSRAEKARAAGAFLAAGGRGAVRRTQPEVTPLAFASRTPSNAFRP